MLGVCVCAYVDVPDACPASPAGWTVVEQSTMVEPEPRASAAQRLGAQETLGISTLDPGHRPPTMPPGRHITVRVRMLDTTEEVFDVSVSSALSAILYLIRSSCSRCRLTEMCFKGLFAEY